MRFVRRNGFALYLIVYGAGMAAGFWDSLPQSSPIVVAALFTSAMGLELLK